MKLQTINNRKGFTLVEMLGVLAIIAILISVISVGVMSAINRARIVGTQANFKTYETALVAYLAMPQSGGFIPLTEGANVLDVNKATTIAGTQTSLDQVLVAAGTFERRPTWRVGNDPALSGEEPIWNMRLRGFCNADGNGTATTAAAAIGTTTDANNVADKIRAEALPVRALNALDFAPAALTNINFRPYDASNALPSGSICAFIIMPEVAVSDALKLSEEINGQLHTATSDNPEQLDGRFVFRAPGAGAQPSVTAFYYLHHF